MSAAADASGDTAVFFGVSFDPTARSTRFFGRGAATNRTSEIARTLTVISGILLPLTLVTGIYGMNFQNMPELTWRWGYFGVLGLLVVLSLGLFCAFWRVGWVANRSR